MKKYLLILIVLAVAAGVFIYSTVNRMPDINKYNAVEQNINIKPDYTNLMIPPNIAPLNFVIQKKAAHYFVKIYSTTGKSIELYSKNPKIMIPIEKWHSLLEANKGDELFFDIYVKNEKGQWDKYKTISNKIAGEAIDNYLVYRKIPPVHGGWGKMGIYQRDLTTFHESEILSNDRIDNECLNCHSFANNKPEKMLLDTRSLKYGSNTILIENEKITKLGTKFGYISWHPGGKMAVYTINKVRQFYHTTGSEVRDVIDMDSMLAYFLVESGTIKKASQLCVKDRMETYPAWSPDGKYLYFCSAPILWNDTDKVPPAKYKENRYDLMRISYDCEKDLWGDVETVLSSKDTGKCILLPRISPDGRWLFFCMCDYGSFPVYRPCSDLYAIDLKEAEKNNRHEYKKLTLNSEHSESWHSFSSNSKWLAFSSKRRSGEFTRTYLSYIDEDGNTYKPVLMPQKDPEFYDYFLMTFSVPELIIDSVKTKPRSLANIVRSEQVTEVKLPKTMATPKGGDKSPWQKFERE